MRFLFELFINICPNLTFWPHFVFEFDTTRTTWTPWNSVQLVNMKTSHWACSEFSSSSILNREAVQCASSSARCHSLSSSEFAAAARRRIEQRFKESLIRSAGSDGISHWSIDWSRLWRWSGKFWTTPSRSVTTRIDSRPCSEKNRKKIIPLFILRSIIAIFNIIIMWINRWPPQENLTIFSFFLSQENELTKFQR